MRAIYKPCVSGYWFSVDLLRSSAGHQHSPCNTVIPSKFIGLATFFKALSVRIKLVQHTTRNASLKWTVQRQNNIEWKSCHYREIYIQKRGCDNPWGTYAGALQLRKTRRIDDVIIMWQIQKNQAYFHFLKAT